MDPQTGALLLLRRAALLPLQAVLEQASSSEHALACDFSREVDGLPLALDQGGAYLKETPDTLEHYVQLYQQRREDLLSIRGADDQDYPASVATTWSLSCEKVALASPAATDLLTLCAFLAPDAIPQSIFTLGAPHLGRQLEAVAVDPYQFDLVCREALRFSLISREADAEVLSMHRLVQAVVRAQTPAHRQNQHFIPWLSDQSGAVTTREEWKRRAVLAVNAASPGVQDVEAWPACELWIPHALMCATWIEQASISDERGANLVHKAAFYLSDRSRSA